MGKWARFFDVESPSGWLYPWFAFVIANWSGSRHPEQDWWMPVVNAFLWVFCLWFVAVAWKFLASLRVRIEDPA